MIRLMAPDTTVELRRIAADNLARGTPWTVEVDLVADEAHDWIRLAGTDSNGWLKVSLNGGVSWRTLGTNIQTGVLVGSFTEGQRRSITLKVDIPAGAAVRSRSLGLLIGLGHGSAEPVVLWMDVVWESINGVEWDTWTDEDWGS